MGKLTLRQEKFCYEYVKTGNATEAYRQAGYNVKTDAALRAQSSRLLTNANVRKKLEEITKQLEEKEIMSAADIQRRLTLIATQQLDEECFDPQGNIVRKEGSLLASLKAMDILNKMSGRYINKTEISGAGGGPVQITWGDEE